MKQEFAAFVPARVVRLGLAVCIVLQPVVANAQPRELPSPLAEGTLSSETTTLRNFADAFFRHGRRAQQLERQSTISEHDVEQLRQLGERIRPLVGGARQAAASVVLKLKAARKWTPELDAIVVERLRAQRASATILDTVQNSGGARALLDRVANQFFDEVPAVLEEVRREVQPKSRIGLLLEPVLGQPVSAAMTKTQGALAVLAAYVFVTTCGLYVVACYL